jgi:hypothetical protein
MSKDFPQVAKAPKQFKLGHLGTLNQVIIALGKTIRAMADGSIDSQVGSRICNGLGTSCASVWKPGVWIGSASGLIS